VSGRHRTAIAVPLLLGAACATLAAIIYKEIERLPSPTPIAVAGTLGSTSLPALPADPVFAMPPESVFAGVMERPVFSPSRRPVHASGTGATTTFSAFALVGVIISDRERLVLVKMQNGDKLERLHEGDEAAGWQAVSITADRVLFRRGTEEQMVVLDYTSAAPPPIRRQKPQAVKPVKPDQQPTAEQQMVPSQPAKPQTGVEPGAQPGTTSITPAQPAPTEAPAQ
jgi:hypothetical protein